MINKHTLNLISIVIALLLLTLFPAAAQDTPATQGGWTQGAPTSAASFVSGVPNTTAGTITDLVGTMRQIQLGAKLIF